jgi:hypothetical protein
MGMKSYNSQRYHPSTLEKRKGKWYVSVTKPRELQFGKDKQTRKSTGTSDKRQAEYLQHELTQAIYDHFDKDLKKTDKFFEAVRPLLEAEGVNTREWYDKGKVVVTLTGEKTFTSSLRGTKDAPAKQSTGCASLNIKERYEVGEHAGLCMVLNLLGHPIPSDLLTLLDEDARQKVLNSAKPFVATPDVVMNMYEKSEGNKGFVTGFLEKWGDHAPIKIGPAKMAQLSPLEEAAAEVSDPKLEDAIDTYIASRPEKSRKADRLQLD